MNNTLVMEESIVDASNSAPTVSAGHSSLNIDTVLYELAEVTPTSRKLLHLAVTTPGMLATFIEQPETVKTQAREILGYISIQDYQMLDKLVELFLPGPANPTHSPIKIKMGCQDDHCAWW